MTGRGIIDIDFYGRETVRVAKELLGKILVRETAGGVISGRILETEAYTGPGDPASHAVRGPTPRSAIMFGPPGRAYVYFCYGMHHLLNVVTEREGTAGAVLIRSLEPREGLQRMRKNRGRKTEAGLLDGPGKITRALEIDLELNGRDLTQGEGLYLTGGTILPGEIVSTGPRVGIRNGLDKPWRFRLITDPK
ncbi:MAG: DNA-3-methyladenine glycosylase [Candidatus Erginobacter occultus]|nr:DNA-3-methyladenine glycosylase [Candidatus Erginobacter occultus]